MKVHDRENLIQRTDPLQQMLDTFAASAREAMKNEPEPPHDGFVRFEIRAMKNRGGRLLGESESLKEALAFACFENFGDCDVYGLTANGQAAELCIFCGTPLEKNICPRCENE